MSLRETLTEKPFMAVALASALLLACAAIFGFQMLRSSAPAAGSKLAFFSADDGKTWFADDSAKLPPFDKDGKQAVRAYVYRAADGTQFVNHLERFKPEARRALEDASKPVISPQGRPDRAAVQSAYNSGREVKRPGAANWIATSNVRDAAAVTAPKSRNGATDAVMVEP